jgi:hypothetical protein
MEAISLLRTDRPQSMRYNPIDWFTSPFSKFDAAEFRQNLAQEQYISWYYDTQLSLYWETPHGPRERTDSKYGSMPDSKSNSSTVDSDTCSNSSVEECEVELKEYEVELTDAFRRLETRTLTDKLDLEATCGICNGILSVGPDPILKGRKWPGADSKIFYK